jgi:hypothetical protein
MNLKSNDLKLRASGKMGGSTLGGTRLLVSAFGFRNWHPLQLVTSVCAGGAGDKQRQTTPNNAIGCHYIAVSVNLGTVCSHHLTLGRTDFRRSPSLPAPEFLQNLIFGHLRSPLVISGNLPALGVGSMGDKTAIGSSLPAVLKETRHSRLTRCQIVVRLPVNAPPSPEKVRQLTCANHLITVPLCHLWHRFQLRRQLD